MAIISNQPNKEYYEYYCEKTGDRNIFKKPEFIIEQPLYRYRSNLDYALEEIRTELVHISDAEKMNDPFDSTYAMDEADFLEKKVFIQIIVTLIGPYLSEKEKAEVSTLFKNRASERITIVQFVDELCTVVNKPKSFFLHFLRAAYGDKLPRNGYGYKIASFSETKKSIPMWAYYANQHEGLCLEYDVSHLDNSEKNKELREAFCKVHYSNFRPKDLFSDYSLVVKSTEWSHEHEWRLICKNETDFISVPCLTGVYLGMRFDYKKIEDVVEAIKSKARNINLYICQPNSTEYYLHFLKILI